MLNLNLEAERFLSDLSRSLSLVEEEREAVLLELRGHLEHRQEQGALAEALAGLGDPAIVAKAFIEANEAAIISGEPAVSAVHLPALFSSSPWALSYVRRIPRLKLNELAGNLRASWQASRDQIWSVCGILFPGLLVTDFLAALFSSDPAMMGAPRVVALCARAVIAIVGLAALYRTFLTEDQPIWEINRGLLRFALASIGLLSVAILAVAATTAAAATLHSAVEGTPLPMPVRLLILMSVGLPISCLTLRLQPWLVDAALDSKRLSFRRCWILTKDRMRGPALSWLVTVAPLFVLHGVSSFLIGRLTRESLVQFGLGFCALDAICTIAMILAMVALNSIAYRSVLREPIPDMFIYAWAYPRRSREYVNAPSMRVI